VPEGTERALTVAVVEEESQPSPDAAFFILKSYNHENIAKSVTEGVWATQPHNQRKLAAAFAAGREVLLIFSVNGSGAFQGYARMATPFGRARGAWTGDTASLSPAFGCQWETLSDLPFAATSRLTNPWNDNKPVKVSRDGTELPHGCGCAVIALLEQAARAASAPRPRRRLPVEWEAAAAAPAPAAEAAERSRSRSRSPQRHRRSRSRERGGSRERRPRGRDDVRGMSYEEYVADWQRQSTAAPGWEGSAEWWEGHLRSMGWDGRGGAAGMHAFWAGGGRGGGWAPPGRGGGWPGPQGRGGGWAGPPRPGAGRGWR